jgi:hypothetical protein
VLFISKLGYSFIYNLEQLLIQQEMKHKFLAGLPESSLQIIEYHPNMQWDEEGKEFYLDGELYDVVMKKNENGKTLFYCVNDKKEKELLAEFAKAVKSGNDNSAAGKNAKNGIKYPVSDYTIQTNQLLTISDCISKERPFCFKSSIISSTKEVIVPPPRS